MMRIEPLDSLGGTRRAAVWQTPQGADTTSSRTGGQPPDVLQIVQLMTELLSAWLGQLVPTDAARDAAQDPSPGGVSPADRSPGVPPADNARPGPPSPATVSPAAASVDAGPPSPPPAGASSTATGSVDGGGPNCLLVRNRTDQPMDVAMFRNLAPGTHPRFDGPNARFTLPAHGELDISVPDDWQGRLQKYSGSTQDPSNWAEINFEAATGKIWFNESDIPGRNSSLVIAAPDGAVAGSDKSVLKAAPAHVVTVDSSGQQVIKPPQWFTGVTDPGAVAYLNQSIGNTNAYVLPDDNLAVRVSEADRLTIDIGRP